MTLRSALSAALTAVLPTLAAAQPAFPPRGQPTATAQWADWQPVAVPRAATPAPAVRQASAIRPVSATAQPASAPAALPAPAPKAAFVPAPVNSVPLHSPPPTGASSAPCPIPCAPACGPDGTVWGRFEWLYWTGQGQSLPPLVTVSPPGTARAAAGVLGQPTTVTTFGGDRANDDFRNGFRATGGWWLTADRTCGLEADFFFLSRSRDGAAAASDGSGVISRPFVNAALGVQAAELVSFPGVLAGSVTADATSTVIGGGIHALHNICCDPCTGRVDLVYGFRYFHLGDEVAVTEDLTALGGGGRVPAGTRFVVNDRFTTNNDFYGGVIGVDGERRFRSGFFAAARATVALGSVVQTTTIDGTTAIGPTVVAGGLLAQPTNIGRYRSSSFAVMPELNLRLGYQVTETARIYGGYNFVYLSDAVRAGDQIDLRVNPSLLPPRGVVTGPAVPLFPDRATDFWLQGVSLGVEVRY